MVHIPENLTEFLYWVKERTESFWNNPAADSTCDEWAKGARWQGLQDAQIDEIEKIYSVRFMPEHREFLRVLHAVDRKAVNQYEDEIVKYPFFYNWLEDKDEIRRYLKWPYETILQDVLSENAFWLESWGDEPQSKEEREKVFWEWFSKAPRLLPIHVHRFLVSNIELKDRPVLSVWGSDIIVYGWDLRHYLIHELEDELGLTESVLDKESNRYYLQERPEMKAIREQEFNRGRQKDLPYWKEIILSYSSGYSSFGLVYPHERNDESSNKKIDE